MTHGKAILGAWLILLGTILGTGAANDHLSCQRSDGLRAPAFVYYSGVASRASQRAAIDHGMTRRLDLEARTAAMHATRLSRPIDCGALLPGTK